MLWIFTKFFANLLFPFMVLILTPKWACLFSDNVDGLCIIRNAITRFLRVNLTVVLSHNITINSLGISDFHLERALEAMVSPDAVLPLLKKHIL